MVSCGRPEGLRTVWSCLLAFLFATSSAYAQMIYQQRDVSTNDPQPFLTAPSTASCVDGAGNAIADKSVPDGGFVKNFTTLRADASSTLTGACDWYYSDGTFYRTELRNIVGVQIYQYPPTLLTSGQTIYPYTPTQSIDSRISGTTSGSVSAGHSELGSYRYTFKTNVYSTNCGITPTASGIIERRVNVVACTVSWFLRTTPPVGATFHLPAQEIKVYIPATMSILYGTPENPGPADRALADWNVALAGTGVTFKMVPQSCGSGADCVSFAEGTVAQGCAQVEAGSSSPDGTANAASTVRLPSAFRTRTPERNRRTVAHELGHLLGLNDNSCTGPNSIMGPLACDATTGFTLSPTTTDTLPTTSSTYGNHVQKVCSAS